MPIDRRTPRVFRMLERERVELPSLPRELAKSNSSAFSFFFLLELIGAPA
jgi:hypothetical protein